MVVDGANPYAPCWIHSVIHVQHKASGHCWPYIRGTEAEDYRWVHSGGPLAGDVGRYRQLAGYHWTQLWGASAHIQPSDFWPSRWDDHQLLNCDLCDEAPTPMKDWHWHLSMVVNDGIDTYQRLSLLIMITYILSITNGVQYSNAQLETNNDNQFSLAIINAGYE